MMASLSGPCLLFCCACVASAVLQHLACCCLCVRCLMHAACSAGSSFVLFWPVHPQGHPMLVSALPLQCRARCQRRSMQPSAISDDSAHGMTLTGPKNNPVFGSDAEAQAQVKLEQDLEGSISPLEPVTPNPPQRHCDPHHYR